MLISIVELTVIVLLAVGLFNEEKVAAWEQRIFQKVRRNHND